MMVDTSLVEELYFLQTEDTTRTFAYDDLLPSLPVPSLHHTLERYIDSIKPFVNEEELAKTMTIVSKFEQEDGKDLHQKLLQRAQTERNWVRFTETMNEVIMAAEMSLKSKELRIAAHLPFQSKINLVPHYKELIQATQTNENSNKNFPVQSKNLEKWWEELAYLKNRQPLLPFCQLTGISVSKEFHWGTGELSNPIKNAAMYCYYATNFWLKLRKERLRPDKSRDGKTNLSMYHFRRLYNCVRIPGEDQDSIITYFKTEREGQCPSHVIVLHDGHIFCVDALNSNDDPLNPAEWEHQLLSVKDICHKEGSGPGIALLSNDERTNWAKNRKYLEELSSENQRYFHIIDSAMFVLILDMESATTPSAVGQLAMSGDFCNRLPDKSINIIFFQNGIDAVLSEHGAYDAMVGIFMFLYVNMKIIGTNFNWSEDYKVRNITPVKQLKFITDAHIEHELQRAAVDLEPNKTCVMFIRDTFMEYGKDLIKTFKLHPDSYVQMALQLAFYELHGCPAPTYETAPTRQFYHGRTETVRSCTAEAMEWVKSMHQKSTKASTKRELLKKAVQKHEQLMKEAKDNAGCDRHLLGLYCIAMEEGREIPAIFTDPAFTKSGGAGNFKLSTSIVGYTLIGGAVAPMCEDGYGCFYNIRPERIDFSVTAFKECEATSASLLRDYIKNALKDMQDIMELSSNL